jgi:recombination protein RecA
MYKASESPLLDVQFVSTGLPQLDRVCGGGIPLRRVSLISGPPSMGKSTIALMAVAAAQKRGMKVLWYDAEFSAETKQMIQCGVDIDELDLEQPEVAEEGLDAVEEYLRKNKNCLVVIDSLGGLHSRVEAEKAAGEKTIGAQAGIVSKFIRKVVPLLALNNSAMICITHEFTDIMTGKVKASGGDKVMYHASLHFRLKPKFGVVLKQGDKTIGKVVQAQVKKTKVGNTEGQECDLQYLYDSGFNPQADLLQDALDKGIITKTGNLYFYSQEKLGMISKVRDWMKDHAEEIRTALAGHD